MKEKKVLLQASKYFALAAFVASLVLGLGFGLRTLGLAKTSLTQQNQDVSATSQ